MTKDELITALTEGELSSLPGNTLIVLAKDAEGNSYSPLAAAEHAMYEAETTWSGDTYLTDEQRAATSEPDEYFEAPDDAVNAIVLSPVN